MAKLNITNSAKADIKETLSYIKHTLHNPQAALNLANQISEEFNLLTSHPKSGPLVNDKFLANYGIRFLLVKNYKAYYTLFENDNIITITIIRFLYAKRDYIKALTSEIK